ncbi:MAG: acylphosphatase, partial [Calditrichia bacterium]
RGDFMENKTLFVCISGRVQGVGFRHFAYRKANRYQLKGYVKNLPDGRVEVLAEGDKNKLEQFLSELKSGPGFADVENLDIQWREYEGNYQEFSIGGRSRF